jgi:hypothetical protein
MTFEQQLFAAVASGLRAKQAEHQAKVKVTEAEHAFEGGGKCTYETQSPESVMARRNADALGQLAAAFEAEKEAGK